MTITLEFIGYDAYQRPVYKDQNGQLWKDIDPYDYVDPMDSFYSVSSFEGQPEEIVLVDSIIFVDKRVTY